MRATLVTTLLATVLAPGLDAQTSSLHFTQQIEATVLLNHAGPPAPAPEPRPTLATDDDDLQAAHLRRNILGGAAAGAIFSLAISGGAALMYGAHPDVVLRYIVPRVLAGAGIGGAIGLLLGLLPAPAPPGPCGCR